MPSPALSARPRVTMIRFPALLDRSGYGETILRARIRDGLMPPGVHITDRAVAYVEHEVDAVLAAVASGATDTEILALVRELVAARAQLRPQIPGAHRAPPAPRRRIRASAHA